LTVPIKKNKKTKQRAAILKTLRSTQSHPTAFWIYEQVKKEIPDISLGTVYRNLNLLRDKGEILQLDFLRPLSHFDGRAEPHYHFVCNNCRSILDLTEPVNTQLNNILANETGLKVFSHHLEFEGLCHNCQKLP